MFDRTPSASSATSFATKHRMQFSTHSVIIIIINTATANIYVLITVKKLWEYFTQS